MKKNNVMIIIGFLILIILGAFLIKGQNTKLANSNVVKDIERKNNQDLCFYSDDLQNGFEEYIVSYKKDRKTIANVEYRKVTTPMVDTDNIAYEMDKKLLPNEIKIIEDKDLENLKIKRMECEKGECYFKSLESFKKKACEEVENEIKELKKL